MRVRLLLPTCLLIPLSLGGCAPPQAEFVSDDQVSELLPRAGEQLQESIDTHFGTPQDLVAWLQIPVDFSEIAGEVIEAKKDDESEEVDPLFAFRVKLTLPSENSGAVVPEDLRLAGVVWDSGNYQDASYETADGQTIPIVFRVAGYDAELQQISVTASPPLSDNDPPEAGSQFRIIGHKLQQGRMSYMRYCMHCHGVSGDGNGPTAQYLNPLPRDYRQGIFKFTSTDPGGRARKEDLRRTIKLGIPGTYMPSFMLLPEDELTAIITYVRWLAMRGELERKMVNFIKVDFPKDRRSAAESPAERTEIDTELADFLDEEFPGLFDELAGEVAEDWLNTESDESVVVVPKTARTDPHLDPDSIARGRKLFLGIKAKCLSCHGTSGRGNGPSNEDFNDVPGSNPPVKSKKPGLYDVWGNKIKPRNLTRGIYRGGRRPLDIYRRIYSGIKGTPMQAFGTTLKEEEIWDLVNYVLHLPFEDRSPEYRAKFYKDLPQPAATDAAARVGG